MMIVAMTVGSLAVMAAQVNSHYSEKHGPFWARCDFYFSTQVVNNLDRPVHLTMHDNGGDGFVKWDVLVEPHTTWTGNILWDTPSVYSHISNHCYVFVDGNHPIKGECYLGFVENGGPNNTYVEFYNNQVNGYVDFNQKGDDRYYSITTTSLGSALQLKLDKWTPSN